MIASVIVDVPAKQTDRAFDYRVPESMQGLIQSGMRVVVPFGPRKIQGFVVGFPEQSSFKQLKEIEELLDIVPVLNQELLSLALWLSQETLCYQISAMQVMLPTAMKAKYKKVFEALVPIDDLPQAIIEHMDRNGQLTWKQGTEKNLLRDLQTLVTSGQMELRYEVKNTAKKKKERIISLALSHDHANEVIQSMSSRSEKQKKVLHLFLQSENTSLPVKFVNEETGATSATSRTMIDSGFLEESQK